MLTQMLSLIRNFLMQNIFLSNLYFRNYLKSWDRQRDSLHVTIILINFEYTKELFQSFQNDFNFSLNFDFTHFHKDKILYSHFQCNPRWFPSSWETTWRCAIPMVPCSNRTWRTDCNTTSVRSILEASPRWIVCTWCWTRNQILRSIWHRLARVNYAPR